jgi:hypothetical protein
MATPSPTPCGGAFRSIIRISIPDIIYRYIPNTASVIRMGDPLWLIRRLLLLAHFL